MSEAPSLHRQIMAFTGAGLFAAATHYSVLIALVELTKIPAAAAALAGYVCGGIVSYALNRRWTFETKRTHNSAIWRFSIVAFVGFCITGVAMALFVNVFGAPYLPAQIVTTLLVLLWSFCAHRSWTFLAR